MYVSESRGYARTCCNSRVGLRSDFSSVGYGLNRIQTDNGTCSLPDCVRLCRLMAEFYVIASNVNSPLGRYERNWIERIER